MPVSDRYRRQVALLIRTLPFVATERCFALKGGTAINLFVRNLPRLSVDIDLAYLPIHDRESSLAEIDAGLKRIAEKAAEDIPNARIQESRLRDETAVNKLLVRTPDAQIKIEVTPVLRGCVYDPEDRSVAEAVESEYGFVRTPVVSFPDLYAGKIVAALDRQHPRDLFDVRELMLNEGIDDQLRTAFIVYLLSHSRPIHELLCPTRLDLAQEFERGFAGMTTVPVELDDLLTAREQLIETLTADMPDAHEEFLVSFLAGTPGWGLLDLDNIQELPAVRWRMRNLEKLEGTRRHELVGALEEVLGL
jgi:predicted nucleotidyltransferase component of viral defense system